MHICPCKHPLLMYGMILPMGGGGKARSWQKRKCSHYVAFFSNGSTFTKWVGVPLALEDRDFVTSVISGKGTYIPLLLGTGTWFISLLYISFYAQSFCQFICVLAGKQRFSCFTSFCFFLLVHCDYYIFSCFLVQNGSELSLLLPFFPLILGSLFFFLLAFLFVNCVHSGYSVERLFSPFCFLLQVSSLGNIISY